MLEQCQEDEELGTGVAEEAVFACVKSTHHADHALCVEVSAFDAGTHDPVEFLSKAGEAYEEKDVWYQGGCDEATRYPGLMFYPRGAMIFICNMDGTAYANSTGSITLVKGPTNDPVIGSEFSANEMIPIGWNDPMMKTVDTQLQNSGITCGDQGFTCEELFTSCACECDNDEGCLNTFGEGEWVCEGGQCLSSQGAW